MNDIRFKRSAYWGRGHYIVTGTGSEGRVSLAEDGTWSLFDWITPVEGMPRRPALAEGFSNRKDAAIAWRAICQVADKMEAETNELIADMEKRTCGHL